MNRRISTGWILPAALCVLTGTPALAAGEVVRVEVERREVVLGGRAFGEAGAYEKLVGRIQFAFDPDDPANQAIVDLALAPRRPDGRVEAWADFMVLQPVDAGRRRGIAWLEVSNRGGKASLRYFNAAPSSLDPTDEEDFGDGLLMRQGLTLIWVGWQWDVPEAEGLLRMDVPVARQEDGEPIMGLVRADWVVDAPADTLELGHRGHRAFSPARLGSDEDVLTVRDGRDAPREVVPRDRWRFVSGGPERRSPSVTLDGGFEAGRIYELVYLARDPRVGGLGLAAVRDIMSYSKYDLRSEFPTQGGIAFGVSQTGRFLRHFLYQGFNVDEGGRKVFDGMLIHTAGAGRGSFNHRFGQASRDAHRYSAFFYPTDLFPFTGARQLDPVTGLEEGLLDRLAPGMRPRIMYTNTGYEYWGRAASLVHTSVDGLTDVPPQPEERIYHLAGGQHFVGAFPPSEESRVGRTTSPTPRVYVGNPLDFLVTLRALAVRLVAWVDEGTAPPESRFPTVAEGRLVGPSGLAFPSIPGLESPDVAHWAYRPDYGPRFRGEGIVDRQPPDLGPVFPSQVPQVDGFGNELSGVRGVELRVPVATYTPWALRTGLPGPEGELRDFVGMVSPLPLTPAEAAATGDPRPSLQALYGSREPYIRRVRAAVDELVREGFLLPEDRQRQVDRARRLWDWATAGTGS